MSLCNHRALAAVPGTASSGHLSAHHSADSAEAGWPGKLRAKQRRAAVAKKEFHQWMPHRKNNSTIRQTPIRQEQVWLVPWDAPTFTVCIWQFSCFCCWWVVLVGTNVLEQAVYVQLFCNPLAIKQLHLHAKKLLVWSRIRHCICLPFRFSWSFTFSHKPIFLIILGYICNSACKIKNNLTSSHTLPIKQNSAIRLNIVGRWNALMSEKAKYHLLCIKTILI